MRFKLDPRKVPNGTILVFGISYQRDEPGGETRGRTNPRIFTYAALKAGNLWFFTGTGQVPQAAGWSAVERWFGKDGRVVETVEVVSSRQMIYNAANPENTLPLPLEWR